MNKEIQTHLDNLLELQTESGLFLASAEDVETGYDKAWLRDNFYVSLGLEELSRWDDVKGIWRAILDILIKHQDKINWAIENKPHESWQYIHARYHPETFEEFWGEWGNKQNDAVGAILFKVADLELKGQDIINSDEDKQILQRLIDYLNSIKYWHDPDSGVWEEEQQIHASSIGACLAGLKKTQKLDYLTVPPAMIKKGEEELEKLLPRESEPHFADLAQLSLIWPYDLLDKKQEEKILERVEYYFKRRRGVIRYKNDRYYNKNEDKFSQEAEWTMGLCWLAIIYAEKRKAEQAKKYLNKARKASTDEDKLPELYYSNSEESNENIPLGWSESLFLVACNLLNKKKN